MAGQRSARTNSDTADNTAGRGRRHVRLALAAALALVALAALVALSTPASAGWAQTNCPQRFVEVDDDYPSSSPAVCQFKTVLEVQLLPISSGDTVYIYNGSYLANWSITTNGLTITGESRKGVLIYNVAPLSVPFSVQAADINISQVSLIGVTYGLQVNNPSGARTRVVDVSAQGNGSWGCLCHGPSFFARQLYVVNSAQGMYSASSNLDVDGLFVSTLAGASYRLVLSGNDQRVVNLTLVGVTVSIGVYHLAGTNQTVSRAFIENATYGFLIDNGDPLTRATDIVLRTFTGGFLFNGAGAYRIDGLDAADGGTVLMWIGNVPPIFVNNSHFRNVTLGVDWTGGSTLEITNSSMRDIPGDAIMFATSGPLRMVNVSFDNVSSNAVLLNGALDWNGGRVNNTGAAVTAEWSATGLAVRNLSVTRTWNYAVMVYPTIPGVVLENSRFTETAGGFYVGNYLVSATLRNNSFVNLTGNGVYLYGEFYTISGNTFVNSSYPFYLDVYDYDGPQNWHNISDDNLIDGHAIFYAANKTNLTVPAGKSIVMIVNCTNVSVTGLNTTNVVQTAAAVVLSRNVTITDSQVVADLGVRFLGSDGGRFSNLTILANFLNSGFQIGTSRNVLIDRAVAYSMSSSGTGVNIWQSQNVTVRDVGLLGASTGFYAYLVQDVRFYNISLFGFSWNSLVLDNTQDVVIDRALLFNSSASWYYVDRAQVSNVLLINSTGNGFYLYYCTFLSFTNVTVINPQSTGLYAEYSGNFTLRNVTIAVENADAVYFYATTDFRTYNSTFVSINATSMYIGEFSYAFVAIHNNFYGGAISNAFNYGVWDAGYPGAGNYYDYAVAGFVDEFTGPGQNSIRGHDGIKDAPAYPVGPAKNDNYALMDPWPPRVQLTSPPDGSAVKAGTPLNFSISNFFDTVTWSDSAGGSGTIAYPHDINTTGWADGWHNITIRATDGWAANATLQVPNVTRTFSFEFDSTGPLFSSTPALGTPALVAGAVLDIDVIDPHLFSWRYTVDGTPYNNTTLPWLLDLGASGLNLGPGPHTIILFANDTLNNSATYVWTFYIDARPPSLARTAPLSNNYFQPGTLIVYSASDDNMLANVTFQAAEDGGGWSYAGDLVQNGPSWEIDTSSFLDGCYDLDVFASDEAGHITVDSWLTTDFWSFCIDNTNPDLSAFGTDYADEDVDYLFPGTWVVELDPNPTYEWTFDDAVLLAVTTLNGQTPTFAFFTPGDYNIHLQVTDRAGNFDEVDYTLVVYDLENPVAEFDLNATYPEDLPITLDAAPSTDNDGYWAGGATGTFSWNIEGDGYSSSIDGRQVDITLTEPGFYNITLSVWDRTGNYGAQTLEVRVLDTTRPTIVVNGSRGPFNEGDTVALNATGSSDNDVGSPLVFSWRFTYAGSPQVVSGPLFSFTFAQPSTTPVAITVHVTDRSGVENTTQLLIRINDVPAIVNQPQTVVTAGSTTEWTVQVADNDSADVRTFTLLDGPSGMSISGAGILAWQTAADSYGVYNVAFRVSDGLSYVDVAYVLTVRRPADPSNHAPYFSSFPVQSALPGAAYSYAVTMGDPDAGDRLTLAIASGPDGMTVDTGNVLRWTIPADGAGVTYSVSLLLSDGLETVYQNFTIRARANDAAPVFVVGKVPPTASVEEGKDFLITLDATFATDQDDTFDLLTFFATASDGTVLGVSLEHTGAQWTLRLTGLKAGGSTVTLRVADPSGLHAEATIVTTVTPAPVSGTPSPFPLWLLLAAALGGVGVLALVVMKRRRRDEPEVAGGQVPPAPAAPAPKAPAQVVVPAPPIAAKAEVVQVEVVRAPAAAAVAGAAVGAAVGAAAASAPAAASFPAAASPKPKAATYVVEGLFVIYQDGRMIYSKTDIGRESLGDPELVSSMFTAVQQFIKDSFSAEGELNKMGYGDNQILIERGKTVFMATINFGEPDKELQETMRDSLEKMEYAYAGIIEAWDGQQNRFADVERYVAPVLALTNGITRQDVLAATTTRDVKVLSQLEFFQGFVRLKVGIKNDTEAVITKVTLDIDFNEDVLRLQRIEPASYKTSGARVMLNVLNPGEKSSVAFYFDPQICTETNIDGIVRFRDYKGVLSSVTMKTRKAEVVCPLFFTKEHANTAMLKRLIENELQEKDSKIYTITKLPPYVKHKDIFDVCKSVVLSHDVHMVREFVSYNPFSGEAWFYGETKVKGYKIVIRAAVREDNAIEFFAASSVIKAVTGLLAEFNHTLTSMIVERYSDVKIEQVYDEAKKHEIQAKALIDRLGEGEAGAGETEQPR